MCEKTNSPYLILSWQKWKNRMGQCPAEPTSERQNLWTNNPANDKSLLRFPQKQTIFPTEKKISECVCGMPPKVGRRISRKKVVKKNLDFHGQSILHRMSFFSLGICVATVMSSSAKLLSLKINRSLLWNWVILQCQLDWIELIKIQFFSRFAKILWSVVVCDLNNGLLLIPYPFSSANFQRLRDKYHQK